MPKFWKRQGTSDGDRSPWFVKIKNRSPPPPAHTFQLEPAAIRVLQGMGLESGDAFEASQFWTLHDLGLTYTLGEDYAPERGTELSEADAENIPPEQRATFIKELLEDYEVAEIQSDGFYRLLLSVEQGPRDVRFDALEQILSVTPIHAGPADGLASDPDPVYTSSVFGALVCRAFSEFIEQRTVATGQYCEPIGHRDEYAYLVIEDLAWDLVPDLIEFFLDIPEFFLDEVLPDGDTPGWEKAVLEEIHTSQFLGDGLRTSDTIGKILFDGLNELQSVIIVPQKVLTDSEIKHTFTF
ncbi:hypothetical protein [Haloterrigena alkaliphila]|uniref:Uncharacterized protein n=1 Tax=Haloterrigena alkaliphila TaxID=2816475 RepID=A0A8A2VIB0_9EURY|nr:hypothetical protein [Haloterrigena alkaliphila]QSX01087.1 hypothetical protein J0X25_09085 [Haloterrigena alkaliphila]